MISWRSKKKKSVLLALPIFLVFSFAFLAFFVISSNKVENKKMEVSAVKGASTKKIIPTKPPSTSKIPTVTPSLRKVYFGAWTQGFFDPSSDSLNTAKMAEFQSMVGKKVAIAHYYRGWHTLESVKVQDELRSISGNGWRPMISANPYFFEKCVSDGGNIYKTIASGKCDDFMHAVGKNFKAYGRPMFLRFAWEMNIDSMEWSVQRSGSSNSDFISAWQRFHNIIYQEGATNVLFVFSPNVGGPIPYKDIYPGDSYVDWTALDGYNWGTTQSWSKWETFSQVFRSSYNSIVSVAPNKPLMIAEANSTDKGGDKSLWYKDTFMTQIPNNFPRVKAIVVFNEDKTTKENVNWIINISQDSLNSFKSGISMPIYKSSF